MGPPRKPQPPIHRKPQRLPARERMTLAIGMLCQGGMVIATDTQLTCEDGRTEDAVKVRTAKSTTGSYVIAYSGADANSANTLVSKVANNLTVIDTICLSGVESIVEEAMCQWFYPLTATDGRTNIQLIIGAAVGLEVGLYWCEPPNTVNRKTLDDDGGYVAAGAGKIITDSLSKTLFGGLPSPRECLNRLSYLMYRAKKDCAGFVGGKTDAILLLEGHNKPLFIERLDMACAEAFGPNTDKALAKTASVVLGNPFWSDPVATSNFVGNLDSLGLAYQRFQFHARTGEEISRVS